MDDNPYKSPETIENRAHPFFRLGDLLLMIFGVLLNAGMSFALELIPPSTWEDWSFLLMLTLSPIVGISFNAYRRRSSPPKTVFLSDFLFGMLLVLTFLAVVIRLFRK